MAQAEVVVLSGVRTAIGDYGGGLKDKPPTELAAAVVREVVKRAGIQPEEVEHVVFGNVIHTDVHDMYLARVAAINGGLSNATPALTLNRLCGSGLRPAGVHRWVGGVSQQYQAGISRQGETNSGARSSFVAGLVGLAHWDSDQTDGEQAPQGGRTADESWFDGASTPPLAAFSGRASA